IQGLIGFFVNQLVIRVRVKSSDSFRDLLMRVREICLGAYAHQNVPFEKLVEELGPERDLGRSPFFQAKLIWQDVSEETLEVEGARPRSGGGSEVDIARFDLVVSMMNA